MTPLLRNLLTTWGVYQFLAGYGACPRELSDLEQEVHKGTFLLDIPDNVFPLKPTLR